MKSKDEIRYKTEGKNINKFIFGMLLILFIGLFIFSGIKIVNYFVEGEDNKKIIEEIANEITVNDDVENQDTIRYSVNFKELKEKNSDTVGFLKVNGTDIEYIVVKASNNSYYLYHNFNKNENASGWIFADYRNKLDGTDKNIVIYGHNMRNGTMFGTLKNILNDNWQESEENRNIVFITENEATIYRVFSVYQIENEDYYIKTNFNEGEFENFINTIKSRSKYNFNVDINENDSILTLSTCANNNKYRVVLHAKKINEQ